jgi:hypothetical protein
VEAPLTAETENTLKSSVRKALTCASIGLSVGMAVLLGAAPANAATSAPVPSATGGTVTVCAGTRANLNDSTGKPLPLDVQQRMIDHLTWKCANPGASSHGMYTQGAKTGMTPLGTTTPQGYLSANLSISPGLMTWSTTANSMSYGTQRTLDCQWQQAGSSWSDCGSQSGTGTSLSTRTNQDCPVPGESVEVDAWLTVGRTQYYDAAYGTTR